MRTIKYLLLLVILVHSFVACDNIDFGDTNENRNGALDPATSGLFSGAIMSYATLTGRSGITVPTVYVQYQSQVTYTDEMRYAELPYSWFTYYTQSLAALSQIIAINSDPANHTPELMSQGFPANQIGSATILRAIIMKRVTDTYGDVSYSQAFQELANIAPAYDKQEDIYKNLIAEVKTARDNMDENEAALLGDLIYNGDVANWKKLANSLLLQMTMQLSKKYPGPSEYAAVEFNAALADPAGVIEEVDEEAWFTYQDLTGFRNPWFANRTADYFLSLEFTDALKGNVTAYNPTSNHTFDERFKVYTRTTGDGVPYGYRDGSGAGKNQMNRNYYWNATSPLPIMTASYTFLNRAEAAALGWTGEDAATMLTDGILLSYETLENHSQTSVSKPAGEVITPAAASYAAARVTDAGTVGMLQVIREEKWISLFGQAFDAWSEWRRTETPALVPATDFVNDGQIPRRYLYPTEEPSLNAANYQIGVSTLVPAADKNTSRVWWDQ